MREKMEAFLAELTEPSCFKEAAARKLKPTTVNQYRFTITTPVSAAVGEGLSTRACLDEIAGRLTTAAAIAKAAVACAEAGSDREALRIALDLDELLSETTTLPSALLLIGRMQRDAAGPG